MEDNCQEFLIDPSTRAIIEPDDMGVIAVMSDENVRPLKVSLPRWYHGVDLSAFNFRVNWMNAVNEQGTCPVKTRVEGDEIKFEWAIERQVTEEPGIVFFSVCAMECDEEGVVSREWNSKVCTFEVAEGLEYEGLQADYEAKVDWMTKAIEACEKAAAKAEAASGLVDEAVKYARDTADAAAADARKTAQDAADSATKTASKAAVDAMEFVQKATEGAMAPWTIRDTEPEHIDGSVWLVSDEEAAEIIDIRRWDADDTSKALVPDVDLTPSEMLAAYGVGVWKSFKLAQSAIA